MVEEQIVGQPRSRHDVAPLHQPLAHGPTLLGIEHTLRSDEGDQTAFAYRVDRLHEEVVVERACALTPHGISMGREKRIEQCHVPEWYIADGHVVMAGIFGFDALEAL